MSASEATANTAPTHLCIEPLTAHADFDRCVDVQQAVWGYDPSGMASQKMFLLASQIGGQVLGAFAGTRTDTDAGRTLVGYAMALPGVRNGHVYLHSHHLAVLPAWRGAGIGRRLKLAQREEALTRGIELIEWTFDPLEVRNAHLNVARLGAVVRRYRRNFYGASSSPLHGGLPTDRVFAEWWLRSPRVLAALGGQPQPGEAVAAAVEFEATEFVDVPAELSQWKADPTQRERARAVQARNADALESAFARGLAVLGYQRIASGGGRFQLGRWDEPFSY